MEKRISSRIQHKIDTYSNWDKAVGKFKPLSGELVIFTPDNENDVRPIKFKVGNGNKFINELDFITLGLSGSGDNNINMNTTQSDWAQTDTQAADYIKNKPGDEIEEEEIINFVENYQLQEGQEVAPSVFTFGTISGEMTPQIGEKVRMFVKTSDNENIFIGEETLYHDAVLQETMGGVNDDPWACCTINSTVKNAAEAIQTGNLPIANETIPYAFAIVIVPDGRGGGYISIASTENLAGLNITLQRVKINLTTIKLTNNALNIDLEPIENSNNLITSGGVYEALDSIKIQHISDYDDTTSNLDACITEGEYIYYNNGYNVECKLIVKNNDIEGIRTSIIQVLICTTLISFEDAVDPFKVGIQWRTGELNGDGGIVWEDFNYVLTDKELYTLIPEHNENGLVLTTNSLSNRDYKWDKPKYVPTPKTEDVGKCLVATSTDPHTGYTWEDLSHLELPVIKDVAGFTELDKATESGVYRYIADNGLETVLFVSEYPIQGQEVNGKVITQLILKTTGTIDLSNDNLGRGLIGPGVFIRTGVGNNQNGEFNFSWAYDGKFSNIHDLPQAPTNAGHHILKSIINDNNELIYNWEDLYGEPLEEILNSVSTWLNSQMTNVAFLDKSNTFNGAQTIKGNLNIEGNIFQTGDNYVTHAEHVYTEDDYIILRDGAKTPLANYAGFEINNYDGNNATGHLVFDNQGTARVGDIGEEEPLTTRAEANEIIEGSIATWGIQNGAPVLTSGISIMILTQNEYDSIVKDNNTLYLIKEG